MANWVIEHCEELLQQLNEVPFTDERDEKQLAILIKGVANINNLAMEKAAVKTRTQMRGWSLDGAIEEEQKAPKKPSKNDAAADELTRLRPIR